LTAQGYNITGVTQDAAGNYTITSTNAAGVSRTVIVNATSGAVTDTVAGGGAPATGVPGEGDDANQIEDDSNDSEDNSNDSDHNNGGSTSGTPDSSDDDSENDSSDEGDDSND